MAQRYRLFDLPTRTDPRGSLSFAQAPEHIPFAPLRIFMLHGMQDGAERGDHAHRLQHQYVIAMHGRAAIEIDDGISRENVVLNRPSLALHVPPMLWLRLQFSRDAVCAVLASGPYDEADYIRSYSDFVEIAKAQEIK